MNKKLMFSLIGLPLLLVACGGTPEPGTVTLKVWGPNQEQNFLQAKAQEFLEANPDLDLEFEFAAVGEPDLKSVLTLDIAGGADVFAFPDDQLQDLVTAGALSPVQQFKDDVIDRNIEWSVELASLGETVYAYPNTADNGVFMYYDKRHISEEEMTSLDTILAKAEELDSSIVIDPMGGWAMSMWFATSGNISWDAATREQTIDWNNEAGLNAAKGMFNAYASNRVIRDQGLMPTLFLENENDITNGIIAGVSGTWNANAFTGILGAENIGMIKLPTFTHGDGEEVQLGSMIGAKLIGVNGFTTQPSLAHQFANFLTSFETQKARAIQLGVGPSNNEASADAEVQAIPSIKAISDQAPYGIPQAKSVSSFYWAAAGAFADAVINEARGIDAIVEETLTAKTEAGDFGEIVNGIPSEAQLVLMETFRTEEKARLIGLSFAGLQEVENIDERSSLQDKLDIFVASVLAVNEG
jgi:arabinogalactan oligomer/maltooligosaccharide transport system substrate-binding protein